MSQTINGKIDVKGRSPNGIDKEITVEFNDVYDGKERKQIYVGDMAAVPKDDVDLSTWLSVITFFNEEEGGRICADVVYLSNPQVRVTVRVKAMVVGTNIRDYR